MEEHKTITFFIEYTENVLLGRNILTADGSLITEPRMDIDAFSLYPYHWSVELTTKKFKGNRYWVRYVKGAICMHGAIQKTLSIPKSVTGKVYIDFSFEINADGVYYNEYYDFVEKKFYDKKKHILAIGNLEVDDGVCIEFAPGQYAVINPSAELEAVYIQFN